MSLEKDGMPDNSLPCEVGAPCQYYSRETGHWYPCDHLYKEVLDFGAVGKLPVYLCAYWAREGEYDLMTEEQTKEPR